MIELKFRYYEIPLEEKYRILDRIRLLLEGEEDILFAYVHGSFINRKFFRDIDVAIWLRDPSRSFYYVIKFPVNVDIGIPLDVQVLNEAPLPFKYSVFTQGMLLTSKNEDLRSKVVDSVIRIKRNHVVERAIELGYLAESNGLLYLTELGVKAAEVTMEMYPELSG